MHSAYVYLLGKKSVWSWATESDCREYILFADCTDNKCQKVTWERTFSWFDVKEIINTKCISGRCARCLGDSTNCIRYCRVNLTASQPITNRKWWYREEVVVEVRLRLCGVVESDCKHLFESSVRREVGDKKLQRACVWAIEPRGHFWSIYNIASLRQFAVSFIVSKYVCWSIIIIIIYSQLVT